MEPSPIRNHYDMQIAQLHLERQLAESEAALRQAKFDLRESQTAQALYCGSFRALRDKLTKKKEAAETALRHTVAKAITDLSSAQRELDRISNALAGIQAQLASLPDWESLNDGSREWNRLEALYCIEAAQPLLEANLHLLTERRNQFNGTYAGQLKTRQTLAEIYTAPEEAGEACKPWILRLAAAMDALEIPFVSWDYFENPTAFLSFATKFTRMDRINTAITQTEAMQKLLAQLQKQLEETL